MSSFEFVFSLFGLLLGLSLAEVVTGLARTLEARTRVRVGFLTPLLGIFVMVDITSFWAAGWRARDYLPASFATLLFGLAFTATYYLAASLVFPREPERWSDLDDHYFRHRRTVLGIVLGCNLVQVGLSAMHPVLGAPLQGLGFHLTFWPMVALVVAGIVLKGRVANAAVLAVLTGMYVLLATMGPSAGG